MATSTAVLTELFHLVGDSVRETDAAWRFIRSGAITLVTIADHELPDVEALMRKYRDLADGLRRRDARAPCGEGIDLTIFTVDRDDFETYRIGGRKRFRIVPARV